MCLVASPIAINRRRSVLSEDDGIEQVPLALKKGANLDKHDPPSCQKPPEDHKITGSRFSRIHVVNWATKHVLSSPSRE